MADTVSTNVIFKGTKSYIIQLLNQSDGTGEADVTKIDVSSLIGPDGTPPAKVSIQEVEWDVQKIDAIKIAFDATADDTALLLPTGTGYKDFRNAGGLVDPQSAGSTGDIKLTTVGAASGGTYDILLHVRLYAE